VRELEESRIHVFCDSAFLNADAGLWYHCSIFVFLHRKSNYDFQVVCCTGFTFGCKNVLYWPDTRIVTLKKNYGETINDSGVALNQLVDKSPRGSTDSYSTTILKTNA